ncbi:PREDICTED: uncharacterized protein LOC108565577 [Nicrophorus vespilloides]|uniref:Uncharacterized protein LOC108565577 n=1 Tax=Nicrophorus vespilloides TaxID=110193 RepID=A0ABM1N1A4_NICVS|nr:PREDICTED: uncharacterized protein LOC108565577 [Nicrophorus vespilloides]
MTNTNSKVLNRALEVFSITRLELKDPTFINHTGNSISDLIIITDDLVDEFQSVAIIGPSIASDHLPVVGVASASMLTHRRRSVMHAVAIINAMLRLQKAWKKADIILIPKTATSATFPRITIPSACYRVLGRLLKR